MTNQQNMADVNNDPAHSGRWAQLIIGILCMALVANLQYGWTLFVGPMDAAHHWGRAAIQVAFSIFILTETWLVPVEGWLVDHFGPRPVVATGAIFAALAWVIDSQAESLAALYFAAILAGLGAGCVYGTCVGNALKWFPDKRGLAAGLTAAGFGAGAAITVIPIAKMINFSGYEHAFMVFGIGQGVGIFLLSMLLVRPRTPKGLTVSRANLAGKTDFRPSQMVKTKVFWMMYATFVAVAAGGIMATAQIGPIAHDFGLAKLPITLAGLTLPLLTMTLSIDSLCNGFTRPLCGFISDKIGRENTMFIVFTGEGLAMLGLMYFGENPYLFIFFAAMIFLCWGEIYSIFPAISADTFGTKYATVNAGMLYTAKGTASLLVPLASILSVGGRWDRVFITAAAMSIAAAFFAKFVLSPVRRHWIEGGSAQARAGVLAPPSVQLFEQTGE